MVELTRRQIAARSNWVRRRQRYGPSGMKGCVTPWPAPVPAGLSPRQIAGIIRWALRREKYGPSGLTPEGRAALSAKAKRRVKLYGNQHTFQKKCKRGHSLLDAYTYMRPGGIRQRQCRVCVRLKTVANRERRQRARMVPEARARMIACGIKMNQRPDSLYLRKQFLAAKREWQRLKEAA